MEKANKHVGTSSFTVDLFGPKDSPTSSSAGYFGSIFGPPTSMVPGRAQDFNGYGNAKHETTPDYKSEKSINNPMKKGKNWSNDDENGKLSREASYYNSSIYYGAQQVYSPNTNLKKDGDQNQSNSNGASRGNWWQGSVYY